MINLYGMNPIKLTEIRIENQNDEHRCSQETPRRVYWPFISIKKTQIRQFECLLRDHRADREKSVVLSPLSSDYLSQMASRNFIYDSDVLKCHY